MRTCILLAAAFGATSCAGTPTDTVSLQVHDGQLVSSNQLQRRNVTACEESCTNSTSGDRMALCDDEQWKVDFDNCLICGAEYPDIYDVYSKGFFYASEDCNLTAEAGSPAKPMTRTVSVAPEATGAPVDSPPVDEFLRRHGGRVAVIGDRVYYEGGEVSQKGFPSLPLLASNTMTTTLSMDLSSSWFPSNVTIPEISCPDEMPETNTHALLVDAKSQAMYIWGGDMSYYKNPPNPPKLWKFNANDTSWGKEEPASVETFESIERTEYPAYASGPNTGFIFGGRVMETSEGDDAQVRNPSQHLSFDFETRAWEKHNNAPYSVDGTFWGGEAIYGPEYGPNGLIFEIGGLRGRASPEPTYLRFDQLHFIDPVTGNFLYGGANQMDLSRFHTVSVLSLPSFTWTLANVPTDDGYERQSHGCAVVGKSQMFSWGGLTTDDYMEWRTADIYPQGLGFFDMNKLEWTEGYNADGDEYKANEAVVSKRATSVEWSSPEVSALFGNVVNNTRTEDDDSLAATDDNSGSSVPVGAIAGGVVGGVVAIAAAIAAI
ncbi:hypothetical protein F5X68DRAFT_234517 [Plectosphaerella plurivora]|uniref:Kelch repeat protein n=1 Tax=Plectosphaerella plurivora TaxID=936078 RepID=A0A9P8V6R4_9PEZI|nr:hypothetical protein F5X68DRAFT_234517 [Plectosphaerella plurivora]